MPSWLYFLKTSLFYCHSHCCGLTSSCHHLSFLWLFKEICIAVKAFPQNHSPYCCQEDLTGKAKHVKFLAQNSLAGTEGRQSSHLPGMEDFLYQLYPAHSCYCLWQLSLTKLLIFPTCGMVSYVFVSVTLCQGCSSAHSLLLNHYLVLQVWLRATSSDLWPSLPSASGVLCTAPSEHAWHCSVLVCRSAPQTDKQKRR